LSVIDKIYINGGLLLKKQYAAMADKELAIKLLNERHSKIYCVNGNTGFNLESRIFYFIDLQNEEDYERKESSSAR